MTDDTRRLLTEYIGECWHEIKRPKNEFSVYSVKCIHCKRTLYICRGNDPERTRTFTTPADLHAVYGAMVRKGDWNQFYWDSDREFCKTINKTSMTVNEHYARLSAWLFCLSDPSQIGERMALAAEFIGREK